MRPHLNPLGSTEVADLQKVTTPTPPSIAGSCIIVLGGFSTGANLVLEHAYRNADIAGLLLFSPAFKSDSTYDWLTPWLGWARPWLREPDGVRPMQNPVRYMMVPTNGFAQF